MKSFETDTILDANGTVLFSETRNLENAMPMWELDALGETLEGAATMVISLNGERTSRYSWDGSMFVGPEN